MPTALKSMIIDLVSGVEPTDDLGRFEPRLLRAVDALGLGHW